MHIQTDNIDHNKNMHNYAPEVTVREFVINYLRKHDILVGIKTNIANDRETYLLYN